MILPEYDLGEFKSATEVHTLFSVQYTNTLLQ